MLDSMKICFMIISSIPFLVLLRFSHSVLQFWRIKHLSTTAVWILLLIFIVLNKVSLSVCMKSSREIIEAALLFYKQDSRTAETFLKVNLMYPGWITPDKNKVENRRPIFYETVYLKHYVYCTLVIKSTC